MHDCLFCAFVAGEIAPDVVYDDEHVLAFRDINPVAPVHVLIIPKRHIESAAELTPEDAPIVSALLQAATTIAAQEGVAAGGYRLVTNIGSDGGQSVLHLHLHLLGGRNFGWPPG